MPYEQLFTVYATWPVSFQNFYKTTNTFRHLVEEVSTSETSVNYYHTTYSNITEYSLCSRASQSKIIINY
jgi:hypothetical protein